jgi:hypothetical protein
VNKSGRTRLGNSNLKRLLGIAAMAAIRDKASYLRVYYRRIAARRGSQRALVAMMHKLAIAIWHVLYDHVPYQELGADHFTKRDPERAMHRITREANSLGLTNRFDPSRRLKQQRHVISCQTLVRAGLVDLVLRDSRTKIRKAMP